MNEQFKELLESSIIESRQWTGSKPAITITYDTLDQFAQLIVRDCLKIVNRHEYSYHEADPLWETAQLIKEHFGVES
jgi:hypothetical protein